MPRLKSCEWVLASTEEEIAFAVDALEDYSGFCGTNCRICGKTANVLNGHTWSCPICSGMNKPMTGPQIHEMPDIGPTALTIRNGIHKSQRWQVWQELHYA